MNETTAWLSSLIDMCRGNYRSIEEYARDCGVGTATIYRLARGEFKRMPSEKVLRALADNVAPGCTLTFEDLLLAVTAVLDHRESDPLEKSRKIRRDARAAEMIFDRALMAYIDTLPTYIIVDTNIYYEDGIYKQIRELNHRWSLYMKIASDGAYEDCFFDVRYRDSASVPLHKDHLYSIIGRFVMEEGPDLSNKWLHLVMACPDPMIADVARNTFENVVSPIPLSIVPICTETGQLFPEIVLCNDQPKLLRIGAQ